MNILRYQFKYMIRTVKVMPDFNSSGIWNNDTGVMVSLDKLDLSPTLQRQLNEWIEYYDNSFENDYTTFKPWRTGILNGWGRRIAVMLKEELKTIDVYYIGEDETGMLKPELITEEK